MTEDTNRFSVRFNEAVNEKFDKLSLKLGRTKRRLLVQMVDYFYKTKKDPMDLNDEMLKNSLVKNHKDLIGFIKTQENDLLIPTRREVDRMVSAQKKILEYFNETVTPGFETVVNLQRAEQTHLKAMTDFIKGIGQKQWTAEHLKKQFLEILEGYAKARENIGMMKGREKDELLARTKSQVESLR